MAFSCKFKHHFRCIPGNAARHFLHPGCVLFLCMSEKLTSPGGLQRNGAPVVKVWYRAAHNNRRETSKEAREPTTIRNIRIFRSCVLFTNLRALLVKNRWKKSLFNIIRITEAFCFYQLIWSSKQHCQVAKNNIITTILQRWKLRSLWKVVETMKRRIFFHLPGTSNCFTWESIISFNHHYTPTAD